ncbi:TetR family transcriptional regulator [Streptomyces sp. NPDC001941]|uniref:TetR/AcrR family transcriptional regulator n=1 Tax=Streptomyces sp. NPDC001941 TaxID=3154659 RepID=UPI003319BA7F
MAASHAAPSPAPSSPAPSTGAHAPDGTRGAGAQPAAGTTGSGHSGAEGPPPATERRRDSAATRRRLLEAAHDLFAERGYEGTKVRDIAERAGANQALLFRYFGSKQALLAEVVAQGGLEQVRETPPAELFETTLRSMLTNSAAGSHDRSLEVYLRSVGRGEEETAALREVGAQYQRALASLSDAPDSALRADLAMAWLLGIGIMRTVVGREPLAGADPETVGRLVLDTLQHLWRAAPEEQE